jgi:hypothetical protein
MRSEKFRALLEKLLERSRENKVEWVARANEVYVADFPASAVTIRLVKPETEPDYYLAELLNDRGKTVANMTAMEAEFDAVLLAALYDEAFRLTSGWDKAIEDAERALDAADSKDPNGDDVPF